MDTKPWYISLAALWNDDLNALKQVFKYLEKAKERYKFPLHHIAVPSNRLHVTILGILQINGLQFPNFNYRFFSKNILLNLIEKENILSRISKQFTANLLLDAYEIRVYENGTVLQFQGPEVFSDFRKSLRVELIDPVDRIANSYAPGKIISLVEHENSKNSGAHAYGSIARSSDVNDKPNEMFRFPLDPPITFKFSQIHLLTSDRVLSNPRYPNIEDIIIKN